MPHLAPERLQRRRTPGFHLQADSRARNGLPAKCVDRTTPWGNPFVVRRDGDGFYVLDRGQRLGAPTRAEARAIAVRLCEPVFERNRVEIQKALRGFNLACFCGPDDGPCHVDVLLRIANGPLNCGPVATPQAPQSKRMSLDEAYAAVDAHYRPSSNPSELWSQR